MTGPLVGRAEELDFLAGVLRADSTTSVVVAGGAGVGKSRLLAALLERASRRRTRAVLVRATRSTATIPFGPFAPWTPDSASLAPADRLHVLRTTARTLLGEERNGGGPTLVAIDDAHLLDDGSAALVLHLVVNTTACVVATVRTGEPSPDAVVALWKEGLADRLELQPLSEPETAVLSEQVLGGRLDRAARRRLWSLSHGTPLYLCEVLHAGVAQGVLAPKGGMWHWRGDLRRGGEPGGMGQLGALLDDRLAGLESAERKALELVAIGEPLPLDVISELGCLDALAGLERRGLVTTDDRDDQHAACLAHPLFGELLRAELPRLIARAHHQALAAAAVAAGWHDRDPLRVAAWWLEGGRLPGPADVFVVAARRAIALGEWCLADRLARAAASSGAGAEATLVRAAALVHAGGWGQVEDLLAEVSPDALDGDQKAEWARLQGGFLAWSRGRPEAGRAALVEAATRLPAPARSRTLAEAASLSLLAGELPEAARLAAEAMGDAGPSTDLRVRAMAVAAAICMLRGHTTAALQIAELASPYVAADPYPDNPVAVMGVAQCLALVLDGRLDEANAAAEATLEPLLDHEVEGPASVYASVAGRVALLGGRLSLARQRGHLALTAAGPGPGSQWPAAVLAMAAAQLGDTAAAAEAIRHADGTNPAIPLLANEVTLARCWLQAATGELSAARDLAAEAAAGAAKQGIRPIEVFALLDLARLGAPEAATERLQELAATTEGPFTAAAAAYAHASALGDGRALDRVSARFEAMGALLLAAEAAAGAAAAHGVKGLHRGSLARARLLTARCDGARTPALRDIHAPLELGTLTRREREVVELAARGLTNRQIASRLFVSIRTVSTHLCHAYTKLGTNDRRDLAAILPSPGTPDRPT